MATMATMATRTMSPIIHAPRLFDGVEPVTGTTGTDVLSVVVGGDVATEVLPDVAGGEVATEVLADAAGGEVATKVLSNAVARSVGRAPGTSVIAGSVAGRARGAQLLASTANTISEEIAITLWFIEPPFAFSCEFPPRRIGVPHPPLRSSRSNFPGYGNGDGKSPLAGCAFFNAFCPIQ
jgi:hypothetical protein